MAEQGTPSGYSRPGRRFWYVGDLIIIGSLFAYVTYLHSFPLISYKGGLHNDAFPAFRAAMCAGLLLPLAGIFLVVLVLRVALSWPKHILGRKRLRTLQGLALGSVVLYGGAFFMGLPRFGDTFVLGFRKYAQANVDVAGVRAWLSTVDPEDCPGNEVLMPPDGLPQAIRLLKPEYMSLYLDANHRPVVRFGWARLDGAWGIVVGDAEMETPKPQPPRTEIVGGTTLREYDAYRLAIAPGAYVWHKMH